MKQLVYGIQREEHIDASHRPRGIDGTAVLHLAEDGLAAVFSTVSDGRPAADVPRLLCYARVVEDLCRQGPVLPMRYGCLLETTAELGMLLRRNREAYRACLDLVHGCVEMGVRILAAEADLSPGAFDRPLAWKAEWQTSGERARGTSPIEPVVERPTGLAYMAARRNHFDQKDAQLAKADQMARSIQAALAGLFVNAQTEQSASRNAWLVSIHFLVRCEEVERFRAAFHRIEEEYKERLFLTGPWPPYNFVT